MSGVAFSGVAHMIYARVISSFSLDFNQCLSLFLCSVSLLTVSAFRGSINFALRSCVRLFQQRISVAFQRFNAVLLRDCFFFVIRPPGLVSVPDFNFHSLIFLPRKHTYRGLKITSCRQADATICPALSSPVGAEAPCAAEQTAT